MADRLFVSYARANSQIVKSLAAELDQLGYDPFYDADLKGGQRWWDTILDQIEAAEIFLPVVSKRFRDSGPCRRETTWAVELGLAWLPIDIEGADPRLFRRPIADANWVRYDLKDRTSLARLSNALRSLQPITRPKVKPRTAFHSDDLLRRARAGDRCTAQPGKAGFHHCDPQARTRDPRRNYSAWVAGRAEAQSVISPASSQDIDALLQGRPPPSSLISEGRSGRCVT